MDRVTLVKLESRRLPNDDLGHGFETDTEPGVIHVSGTISTGTRGWSLSAGAACRRSVITVHVIATEQPPGGTPDLENHAYEATVAVRRGGRYRLRVMHAYRLAGKPGASLPGPVYEKELSVP